MINGSQTNIKHMIFNEKHIFLVKIRPPIWWSVNSTYYIKNRFHCTLLFCLKINVPFKMYFEMSYTTNIKVSKKRIKYFKYTGGFHCPPFNRL